MYLLIFFSLFLVCCPQLASNHRFFHKSLEAEEICEEKDVTLEIVWVQDVTNSFERFLIKTSQGYSKFLNDLRNKYKKVSTSLVAFRDKPLGTHGYHTDFCYRLASKLTTDVNALDSTFKEFEAGGGYDLPEASTEAMYYAADDQGEVGWSEGDRDEDGFPIVRLMIVVTDAPGKLAGAASEEVGGVPFNGDIRETCKETDYPSTSQVRRNLEKKGIVPLAYVGRGDYAISFWKSFVRQLGLGGIVNPLNFDKDDIFPFITAGIKDIVCPPATSTPISFTSSSPVPSRPFWVPLLVVLSVLLIIAALVLRKRWKDALTPLEAYFDASQQTVHQSDREQATAIKDSEFA